MRWWRRPGPWVFVTLLASYAFFWQSRDWNSASRLMLTYAIVDRGTLSIDGLEDQTHDRASFRGHYYSDKLPGFSLMAALPYAAAKGAFRLPDHPLSARGFSHWPADYWVTLGTSGLLTAWAAATLAGLAMKLGCGPRRGALLGLCYGLGTPAYAYATMSYGHQATAFALLAAFALLWEVDASRRRAKACLAGFLAAYASVIELQVGPVSAILGAYLIGQVVGKTRPPADLAAFALGALAPTLALLGYNQAVFGSPFDMGYFHHDTKIFADVHSKENPLGLGLPGLRTAVALLWGRHRGALFYAPILCLFPFGLAALLARRSWGVAAVCAAAVAAVFAVNVSYPEWTGGWSTGPRLLTPMLPFAILPVAAWLGRGGRFSVALTLACAVAGGVLTLLFVGVGGRLPQFYDDPLFQVVLPLWRGDRLPGWTGGRFARTAFDWATTDARLLGSPAESLARFAPLLAIQGVAALSMAAALRRRATN